jgi:hypothetical protein
MNPQRQAIPGAGTAACGLRESSQNPGTSQGLSAPASGVKPAPRLPLFDQGPQAPNGGKISAT